MQVLTKRYPKNCLLKVMDRYSAVVRNMEQITLHEREDDEDPAVHQPRDQEGRPGPRWMQRRLLSLGVPHLPLSASVDLAAGSPLRCLL
ncbi:thyroid hormone responsive protein, isoform CRA_d [Rattus norvegicus]|uniref:Thyroid hormone responsive protein, isoform CRA_d n=1 Tax=Rattus norvegicus TaxID=10116 RepID=A6I693_RAT|nr:thyroid hormone responsive protein, isoform CRA_d [Rattus norvegicus]